MKKIIIISILFLALGVGQAIYKGGDFRLSPRLLNYQGYLTDTLGNPITNLSVSMTFTIYDAASVGNQKWTETQSSVSVDKGIFHVLLGSVTPIPDSVFNNPDRWLELSVASQTLTPRTRIVSSPYAYTATYADTSTYARNSAPDNDWSYRVTDGADTTMQMGGRWGLARLGNILYGNADSTHVNFGVACTTGTSGRNYKYCFVGGGLNNAANDGYTTVAGGLSNTADTAFAAISGGFYNRAIGYAATIGGGYSNDAICQYTTIAGGYNNSADSICTTVGGGSNNRALGNYSIVCGGGSNKVINNFGTICGGWSDSVPAVFGSILGGYNNQTGDYPYDTGAVVVGGRDNSSWDRYDFIGGGRINSASNDFSTVCGGYSNTTNGYASVIGGGYDNAINYGDYSAICGGYFDTIRSVYGAIIGGYNNQAGQFTYDTATVVCGGWDNFTIGRMSFIGGGRHNRAFGNYSAVAGGYYDSSLAISSFTAGGNSTVLDLDVNSAAFNGQTTTGSGQTRVGVLSKASGTFTIDHPLDPEHKILNHYFVESPEMVLLYRGSVILDADGKAIVKLPDYFDALNESPMIQLTGVKSNDVWVEEKVKGNEFTIGGKPGIEVYWTVTGARKDPSAEITKIILPVDQVKEGGLAGRSLDDELLVSTMAQLERMGKADGFKFRHASEQKRYEEMKKMLEENKSRKE